VPAFRLTQTHYEVNESDGPVVVTVWRNADGPASLTLYTRPNTAAAVSAGSVGQYYSFSNVLVFAAGERTKDVEITNVNDLVYRGDKDFLVLLSAPNPSAEWYLAYAKEATVTIRDDESRSANIFPDVVRPNNAVTQLGSLTVWVQPPEALGRWRM